MNRAGLAAVYREKKEKFPTNQPLSNYLQSAVGDPAAEKSLKFVN